jgi:Holliday junction resolvasome, helicase subunit
VAVGEEADTVETVAEPFLVREGFIIRTPRGRAAAPLAWQHLGLTAPPPTERTPQAVALPLGDMDGRFGG